MLQQFFLSKARTVPGKLKLSAAVLVSLFILVSAPARPDTLPGELRASFIAQPPWGMVEDGRRTGIFPDMVRAIEAASGLSIDYKLRPLTRVTLNLKNGETDFTILFRSNRRDAYALPLVKAFESEIIVVALKGGVRLSRYDDLKGLTVVVPLGGDFGERFDSDPSIIKTFAPGFLNSARMVKRGRVQAAVGPALALYLEFNKLGVSRDQLGQPLLLAPKEAWLQFSKLSHVDENVRNTLLKAVNKLRSTGEFDRILEHHFLP